MCVQALSLSRRHQSRNAATCHHRLPRLRKPRHMPQAARRRLLLRQAAAQLRHQQAHRRLRARHRRLRALVAARRQLV
eukprot:scaffold7207_cov62-Phaeocystis_antarctica.AAC.16